ncbi:MAG: InlB B-repeat-containing protein, partial [Oscillospiraceae bacterium]|nr:InlB B-repeat-containing protein [Oscillospiraceae bacterium]
PTDAPAAEPTDAPAAEPTDAPAAEPTDTPAAEPTDAPAAEPTDAPATEQPAAAEEGEEAEEVETTVTNADGTTTKKKVRMPAMTFSKTVSGVTITVKAEAGTFPSGTKMKVEKVKADAVLGAAGSAVNNEADAVVMFKITFEDAEGKAVKPLKKLNYIFWSSAIAKAEFGRIIRVDRVKNSRTKEITYKPALIKQLNSGTKNGLRFEASKITFYGFAIFDKTEEELKAENLDAVLAEIDEDDETGPALAEDEELDLDDETGETEAADAAPAADAETPAADTETPAADAETPAADAETPAADAETPAADDETPAADAETPAADDETPAADAETSEVDAEMPAVKFYQKLDSLIVSVEAEEGTFPRGTQMYLAWVTDTATLSTIEGAVSGAVVEVKAVDITFKDIDGKEIEPAKPIRVVMRDEMIRDAENIEVVHVDDENNATVMEQDNTGTKADEVAFNSDSFSVYGYVSVIIEDTIITSDGSTYKVTLTAPDEAGIPEDAKLEITEVQGRDYHNYISRSADYLDRDVGSIGYVKFLDISIVHGGKHLQPQAPVNVEIKLLDAAGASDLKVIHFGSKTEEVPCTVDGDTLTFEATGFSVYAVIEPSSGDNARMALDFYSGTTKIATMYVKNDDTAEELETIIYDPGAGSLGQGELFIGWIQDNQNFTTADLGSVLTIDEIREWAAAQQITENNPMTHHRFDAAICKLYTITYKDLDNETGYTGQVVGMQAVPVKSSEYGTAYASHTVFMGYTPADDVHVFEGWILDQESVDNVEDNEQHPIPADRIYENNDPISIKGDIVFHVNAPKGAWLIFDENGKGGKFNAPQFIKVDEVTQRPCADTEMTRKGYTFGGWYDTKEHADAHGANPNVTTGSVTFGQALTAKTTIYASWIPNTYAPYTVILWGQKLNAAGTDVTNEYDVLGSYVNNNGRVGTNIPYTFVNNGDEDYVTGVGNGNGHYTGFCLTPASANQRVTITPEGDAVLNLYYDRIQYNFKFYLYRDGTQNNRYDYANNSGNGRNLNDLVTWYENQTQHPSVTGRDILSETVGGRTYYYFIMQAYYGESISAKWPKYDQITGANGREAVSFVMMVGTKLKPNPTNTGSGTVKGVITVMDDNILGATNNANGNYVVIRFPGNFNNWRYHIWLETVEGEDYTGKPTYTYEGKTYYEETVQVVRSSNTEPKSQNEPTYEGFDYVLRVGQTNGVWQASNRITTVDEKGHKYGTAWTTTEGGTTLHHLNYVYNRQVFRITYFDGNYVDGKGNTIQNRATQLLHESPEIPQGATIQDQYRNYTPAQTEGYVFQGWYVDEGCTTPYSWSTMPIGGIKVYAKWVQVQYRVIMHPNAGTDPNLSWGSDTVSMSFRVDYNGTVSLPTGTREGSGYAFVGWYTDPSCSPDSMFSGDTKLNDTTVTTPYDKTEATELNKWGNPYQSGGQYVDEEGNPLSPTWNKDSNENRFWITKKLDLYAKWRKIMDDTEGIQVEYWPTDNQGREGSNPPVDATLYPDQTDSTAQAACTAPAGLYFKHWVIQTWDPDADNGEGGTGAFVDVPGLDPVLPGGHFNVQEQYAHKEPDPDNPGQFLYTMRLRAEYQAPENDVPTHINWYNNDTTGVYTTDSQGADGPLQINEAVNIHAPLTREGYKFLGWARLVEESNADGTPKKIGGVSIENLNLPLTEDDLFLRYVGEGTSAHFEAQDPDNGDAWVPVTQVAADERLDYHGLVAVWEVQTYPVTIGKTVENGSAADNAIAFKITYTFSDTALTGGDVSLTNGQTIVLKSGDDPIAVPYGTIITVEEVSVADSYDVADYDVEYIAERTTDANGTTIDPTVTVAPETDTTNQFKVTGATTVTVKNTPKYGTLEIKKTTVPEGITKTFQAKVKNAAGQYVIQAADGTITFGTEEQATVFEFSASAPKTIANLPADTYTVEEQMGENVQVDGYRYVDTSYAFSSGETTLEAAVVSPNTTTTVTVTNNYIQLTNVKIQKTLVDDNPKGDSFTFTLQIMIGEEDVTADYLPGMTVTDGGDPVQLTEATVTVTPGTETKTGFVIVNGLPVGASLVVTETGDNLSDYTTTYAVNGGTAADGTSGTITALAAPAEGSYPNSFEFTNTRKTFAIDFKKTNLEGTQLSGAEFTLGRKDANDAYAIYLEGGLKIGLMENVELVSGDYELTETKAPDGYVFFTSKIHFTVGSDGTVTLEDGTPDTLAEVTAATETTNALITIKNTPGAALPNAGGEGTLAYTLGGLFLIGVSLTWIILRRRREKYYEA